MELICPSSSLVWISNWLWVPTRANLDFVYLHLASHTLANIFLQGVVQFPSCASMGPLIYFSRPCKGHPFLVAITSARSISKLSILCHKFLVLYKDRIFLRPKASCLPNVIFFPPQPGHCPSCFMSFKHPKEISLHCIDKVCTAQSLPFQVLPFLGNRIPP